MEKFKVTPTNIRTGTKSPYYVIELPINNNHNNRSSAISMAKEKSRLSDSNLFEFECVKI